MFVDGSEPWGLILWFSYGCKWCFMDCSHRSTRCNVSTNKQPSLSAEAEAEASGQTGLPESGRGNPPRPQPISLA